VACCRKSRRLSSAADGRDFEALVVIERLWREPIGTRPQIRA
jgi:hypothetical protein